MVQFHKYRQKTQDSWVKDGPLLTKMAIARVSVFPWSFRFPMPNSVKLCKESPVDPYPPWVVLEKNNPDLRIWIFSASMSGLCSGGKHLFSKTILHTNGLEKLIWNKRQSEPLLSKLAEIWETYGENQFLVEYISLVLVAACLMV